MLWWQVFTLRGSRQKNGLEVNVMMAVIPEIGNSTREERKQYIRKQFQCRADCDNCGLCKIYRGKDLEQVYADYIEGVRSFADIAREYR